MRLLETALIGLIFVGASYGLFWARRRIRSTPASNNQDRPLRVAARICLAIFILVNLSDWPGTVLAEFWAQHAILAATASTLPLIGVGYFAFEAHDQRTQGDLDSKVAATGRGGVVDHLVDIDVALALLSWDRVEVKKRWPTFDDPEGRPLRWLRKDRDLLGRTGVGALKESDPRSRATAVEMSGDDWQRILADQCIRRVMVGIKDWGPILSRSSDGQQDLIALGEVRLALLPITDRARPLDSRAIVRLQRRCRDLALSFERRSGAKGGDLRPELLLVDQEVHP